MINANDLVLEASGLKGFLGRGQLSQHNIDHLHVANIIKPKKSIDKGLNRRNKNLIKKHNVTILSSPRDTPSVQLLHGKSYIHIPKNNKLMRQLLVNNNKHRTIEHELDEIKQMRRFENDHKKRQEAKFTSHTHPIVVKNEIYGIDCGKNTASHKSEFEHHVYGRSGRSSAVKKFTRESSIISNTMQNSNYQNQKKFMKNLDKDQTKYQHHHRRVAENFHTLQMIHDFKNNMSKTKHDINY